MNDISQKQNEEIDSGIRGVLAAADARGEAQKAATIPAHQRPAAPAPMKASVTPAEISMKTMENTMSEKDQIDRAIKEKQARVQKIAAEIEQGFVDLHFHMTELGQMQHHSTVLALQGIAHSYGAQGAKGKQ